MISRVNSQHSYGMATKRISFPRALIPAAVLGATLPLVRIGFGISCRKYIAVVLTVLFVVRHVVCNSLWVCLPEPVFGVLC